MYYYVLLCIIMYYYVLLCIIMYYYVLLCIIMYYYVLLCIIMYYYVLLCIIIYYVFYSLVLNSAASTGGIEEMRVFFEHSVALYLTGVTWLQMCLHKPWDVSQQVFTVPMWSFHFDEDTWHGHKYDIQYNII